MFKSAFIRLLSKREKVLVVLLLWTLVFVGLNYLFNHLQELWGDINAERRVLERHSVLLAKKPQIGHRLKTLLDHLDPEKTVSSTDLIAKIDAIARAAKLSPDINTPRTQEGEVFNNHSLRVRFKQASIADLIQFDQALKKESPYINLDSLEIKSSKSDPAQLNAIFLISSFEFKTTEIAQET